MTHRISFLFLGYLINSSVHRWHGRRATSASLLVWFDLHLNIHGFIRVPFNRNIGTTTVGTTTVAKRCFAYTVKEENNILKKNMQLAKPRIKEKNKIRRQN